MLNINNKLMCVSGAGVDFRWVGAVLNRWLKGTSVILHWENEVFAGKTPSGSPPGWVFDRSVDFRWTAQGEVWTLDGPSS